MTEARAEQNGSLDYDDFAARVADLMRRIAADDDDAVWELLELARPSLEKMLLREARRLSVHLSADDLCGMVTECVLDLADLADAWKPTGALPWVWARHRMLAHVHRHIGVFADPLDEALIEREEPQRVEGIDDPLAVLESAAQRHPAARGLLDQLRRVASDRDARIWLGIRLERASGNRSPAVTIGADHGMRPEAVRKAYQRVGERLGSAA